MKQTRKFYIILFVISLMAFAVRLQVCRELNASDFLSNDPPDSLDMRTFITKSEAIFEGNYQGSLRFLPFYYAVFLPAVYFILGKGIWSILLVQAFLGGLTVWFTGLCGAMIRNRKTGILAALFVACAFMPILYSAYVLIATLKTFLLILFVYFSLLAIKKRKLRYWMTSGLVFSFLVLTRANTFLLIPAILFFSFNKWRIIKLKEKPLKQLSIFLPAIIFILFFCLPILLTTIYNSAASTDRKFDFS